MGLSKTRLGQSPVLAYDDFQVLACGTIESSCSTTVFIGSFHQSHRHAGRLDVGRIDIFRRCLLVIVQIGPYGFVYQIHQFVIGLGQSRGKVGMLIGKPDRLFDGHPSFGM